MELHEKLIRLRKQKGMSQLELAEALEVSRQAISKWEVGSAVPSTENLRGLSNLYGVSLDYLVGYSDDIKRLSEECDVQGVSVETNNLDDAMFSHKCRFGKVFAVFALIWICVLIFGILRHAIYSAIFFVIDTAIPLGVIYLFCKLKIFVRRARSHENF